MESGEIENDMLYEEEILFVYNINYSVFVL